MADVPIIVGSGLERKGGFYDTSPEILKFILATHLVPVSLSTAAYLRNIDYLQKKLDGFSYEHRSFRSEMGKGGILDLDIHGKPLSILHLALSNCRSNLEVETTPDAIDNALKIFEENMDNMLVVWQQAFPREGKHDLSWASPEQRRIFGFIYKNGPSSLQQVFEGVKEMSRSVLEKWWRNLHNRGGIYE